ncbi:MAG: hypothetical protein CMK09_13655 [Ponticaulis sp.]|nr:hypothetical protein [Ponticaulis sp.]|tara:strand:+ start:37251 stop:38432 length:1182 start_codon:yes stop_codon:yes gene_type:complete
MGLKELAVEGVLFAARQVYARSESDRSNAYWPKGFVVSGYFGESFGIARSADLTVVKLRELGFDVYKHQLNELHQTPGIFSAEINAPRDFGWIIHCNAPEALHALVKTNPFKTPAGPRLGYWAWELEDVPLSWKRISRCFDQVIVPSSFVQDSFRGLTPHVVRRSHPVETSNLVRNLVGPKRQCARTFLVQMDGKSSLSRKNIGAAIRGFRHAFGDRPEFSLVVKTQHLSQSQIDSIKGWIEGAHNISWIDRSLSDEELVELWQNIDCVVSTHRSEGFGLALAEAVSTGRQAYATGWSGNMDFMSSIRDALIDYRFIQLKHSDDVYGAMADGARRWAEVQFSSVVQTFLTAAETISIDQGSPIRNRLSELQKDWRSVAPDQPLFESNLSAVLA